MIAFDAGNAGRRRRGAAARRRALARPRRACAAAFAAPRRRPPPRALGGERDHDRFHTGHGADRSFGALAHGFPIASPRAASTVMEKNTLPSAGDDVGQGAGLPSAACRRGSAPWPSAARTSSFTVAMPTYIGPADASRSTVPIPVDGPCARPGHDRCRKRRTFRRKQWQRSRLSGSASWATRWQGISRTRAATTSRSITAPAPRRRNGSANTAAKARRRRSRRPRARISSWPASATTTICAK